MHRSSILLCYILILLGCSRLMAQNGYERLLNKTYAQRAYDVKAIIENICDNTPDSNQAYQKIEAFRRFAQKHNDKELILEADLITVYYIGIHMGRNKSDRVINGLHAVIDKAAAAGMRTIQARATHLLADYLFKDQQQYEQAFEQFFLLENLLKQIPDEELPDKLYMIYFIGEAYYFFSDYRKTIEYCKQVLLIKPVKFNVNAINSTRNTLGLCYQYLGKLDSSDHYFNLLIDKKDTIFNPVWESIAKGNLGYNCYLRGEYAKAIPLLQADIDEAVRTSEWGLASGSLMPLADIYFKQNRNAEAEKSVLQAREYVRRSHQYKRYEKLYPLLSKLYATKGQALLSNQYLDSTVFVKDSLARQFNALQLLRAQQKSELQQHKAEMDKKDAEKQVKTMERNVLIAFVFLLMVVAIYIYHNQQRKYRNEKRLLDLELDSKKKELAMAAIQLSDFAKSIIEKNQLIETLEHQFGENSNNAALEQLKQVTILTDEEWERFRMLFGQVHSGYLQRLKEKMPGLTPAETRFLALAKLQLSNKEMAAVQGVSTQNVRTIWYRLRKKMNLPEEGSFEDLAESI